MTIIFGRFSSLLNFPPFPLQAAPLPSGNVQDQHILQLIYVLHLVQILLTTDQFSSKKKKEEEDICDQDVQRENTGSQFKISA